VPVLIKQRYLRGIGAVLAFVTTLALWQFAQLSQLIDTSIVTGSVLLSMIAILALLNLRKRFSFLPIGSAVTWLQIHIYVAYMAIFLFVFHIGFRMPSGMIEIMLAILFVLVALSGVVGVLMSRMVPSRLTVRGGNIDFEQIPELRRKIKDRAEAIAFDSIKSTKQSTIADFYVDRLELFFMGSQTFFFNHLLGSRHHVEPLLARMEASRRYLNEEENEIMDRLESDVIEKDTLDFQHTWQWSLKVWLFVHIPISYGLLVLGAFHGLLAFQFLGG